MSIKELTDEEILDFLMASELDGNYSPDELKYLLLKWRYFYRLFNGRYERNKYDSEFIIEQLQSQMKDLNNYKTTIEIKLAQTEDTINSMKNRKLTLKERFSGKIITKEDEDK